MKIREIQIEDYSQIKELHKRYNLKILNQEAWIKFWTDNPSLMNSGNSFPLGWVLEDKEKTIVGSLGNIPKEYYYKNKKFVIACSHAWIVDNKYRLEAFSLLKNFFAQKNIDVFMVTTANSASVKIWTRFNAKKMPLQNFQESMFVILNLEKLIYSFLKYKKLSFGKLGGKFIFYLSYLLFYRKLNFWKKIYQSKKVTLTEIIDNKFDEFWNNYKLNFQDKFLQSRTKVWITWLIQNKIKDGKAWIMSVMENNKLLGYAICLERNNDKIQLKRITLIDLVSLKDSEEVYLSLIKSCINETQRRGYYIFELVGFNNFKRKIFSKFKTFNRRLSIFPFYYKTSSNISGNFLEISDTWDPSLIDGDSFL